MKSALALVGLVLSGCAVAQNDPMWAPSEADIISALNKQYVNEVGPLQGSSARTLPDPTGAGRYTIEAGPPTPTPERAYEWIAYHAYDVLVIVFKTPDDALRCLKNSYAALKPRYDSAPTYSAWPNFPTYVSHSFKMNTFHGHSGYRGESTRKFPEPPAIDRPIQPYMKTWTEQQFAASGFTIGVATSYDAAWVRGRTLMACCPSDDWGEVERFHKLMHALTSVKKPVPPPGPKPPSGAGLPQPPGVGITPPPPIAPQPSPGYRVYIDGQLMRTQAPPTELNGRVLVGLADIFRELGASVVWDGSQRKITATRGSRVVQLWIGRKTAYVDSQSVALDVAPMILAGGKTYVPVRFVSQALGAGVAYDSSTRSVMITTGSMPSITGSSQNPYVPPPPAQGTTQVSVCRETGLRATGICPNTLTRSFAPASVPGPCTTHAQGPKLIVTSPTNGAEVPEQFTIAGTSVPGRNMRVTVVAEATLKATGQTATSAILTDAEAKVGDDGRWSIEANARAVRRDQRVDVRQLKITVTMRKNRKISEQVDLTVVP